MHLVNETLDGFSLDQLVRIQIQFLKSVGYTSTATSLEKESGITAEDDSVAHFRSYITNGDWAAAESSIPLLGIEQPEDVLFLIRRQKYLELLAIGKRKRAMRVLQHEIQILERKQEELTELSSCLVLVDMQEVCKKLGWSLNTNLSRRQLLGEVQMYISPEKMISENRLLQLLKQSMEHQALKCTLHNTPVPLRSLYADHVCSRSQLPAKTVAVLSAHKDEVWYCVYSYNGKYLASCSRDNSCIIWDLQVLKPLHILSDHNDFVLFCAWSPNDEELLTCSKDFKVRLWNARTGEYVRQYAKHSEPVTSCAWLPDGQRFVTGGQDKAIYLWNKDNAILHRWFGERIIDMSISVSGSKLYALNETPTGKGDNLQDYTSETVVRENGEATCLDVSSNGQYVLINRGDLQEVHLWDLSNRRLVEKFIGHRQGHFVIRSCFGGLDERFIVSGSEDYSIYIWTRGSSQPIAVLAGHTSTVNCIQWNPRNLQQFASASDDHTIRIWESA